MLALKPGTKNMALSNAINLSSISLLLPVLVFAYFGHGGIVSLRKSEVTPAHLKKPVYLAFGGCMLLYLAIGLIGAFKGVNLLDAFESLPLLTVYAVLAPLNSYIAYAIQASSLIRGRVRAEHLQFIIAVVTLLLSLVDPTILNWLGFAGSLGASVYLALPCITVISKEKKPLRRLAAACSLMVLLAATILYLLHRAGLPLFYLKPASRGAYPCR